MLIGVNSFFIDSPAIVDGLWLIVIEFKLKLKTNSNITSATGQMM